LACDIANESEKSDTNIKKVKTVVIDPGHGGYDSGSIGRNGTIEKNINLSIALKVGTALKGKGVNLIYTRESDDVAWPSDNKIDLSSRAEIANFNDVDAFVSIHLNTFHLEKVKGIESYYSEGIPDGQHLAEVIHNQIVNDVRNYDRGVKPGNFSVLKKVNTSAVLLELGYISNKGEESLLNSESYQGKIADAIASGILNYFESLT
jgi:N-acetylmuramoyl-L-alanine amidase